MITKDNQIVTGDAKLGLSCCSFATYSVISFYTSVLLHAVTEFAVGLFAMVILSAGLLHSCIVSKF